MNKGMLKVKNIPRCDKARGVDEAAWISLTVFFSS